MRFVAVVLSGALAIAVAEVVSAQYSATTDLVVLNVRVTDEDGVHVPNLAATDFAIFEDNKPQAISVFADADAPVTVGVLIDSSISMWSIRESLIAGATAFARDSHPGNELFAIAFNESRTPALPPAAPFTSDIAEFERAVARVVQPRGRTALYDAISTGLDYAARGRHPRKALVLLSDGDDNASKATFDDVVQKTQASNIVIYAVALVDPLNRDAKPEVLQRLARATGGEAFRPATTRSVKDALTRVASDIRRTYLLGFSPSVSGPSAVAATNEHHALRVVVTSKNRDELRVRSREGYRRMPQPEETPHVGP